MWVLWWVLAEYICIILILLCVLLGDHLPNPPVLDLNQSTFVVSQIMNIINFLFVWHDMSANSMMVIRSTWVEKHTWYVMDICTGASPNIDWWKSMQSINHLILNDNIKAPSIVLCWEFKLTLPPRDLSSSSYRWLIIAVWFRVEATTVCSAKKRQYCLPELLIDFSF